MVKAASRDFATGSDWTPAAGDVKVSIDGGAQANIGTLPTYTNGQWLFVFTGTELTGKSIRVAVVDSATKAVDDQFFIIETYGHASALHPFDLAQAQPANWNALAISAGGAVTVGTVNDKTGYSIAGSVTTLDTAQANLETYIDNNAASLQVESGTAQAATATTLTLAATANGTDANYYVGSLVYIDGGTGARQAARRIVSANITNPAAVVVTVDAAFAVTPDATSTYRMLPDRENTVAQIQSGLATAAALSTVNTNVNAILADTGTDGVVISAASLAAIWTQAFSEPTAMYTWASATPKTILQLLAALARNKVTQSGSTTTLYADDGTTVIATWGVADDGTTFTSAEAA